MIKLGFTRNDLIRALWSFAFGVAAYAVATNDVPTDWKGWAAGAVAAGLSALKNFLLAPDAKAKG